MKKIYSSIYLISIYFLISISSFGQGTFQRIILAGTAGNAYIVRQTDEGGYILAANILTSGNNDWDGALIKTDKDGSVTWNKAYGGVNKEYAYNVTQTDDGGYLMTGTTNSFGVAWDLYVVRTDASGDTLWTKAIGGSAPEDGFYVKQTADGGFIIAGDLYAPAGSIVNIYLIKLDALGNLTWSKTYGGAGYQAGICLSQTTDSGYYMCGYTTASGAGGIDAYVMRLNANGDTLWTKTYGTVEDEGAYYIEQTPDKGFIMTGDITYAEDSHNNIWVTKCDSSGNILWTKTYGGPVDDTPSEVHRTADGGYIVVAATSSFGAGGTDAYLIKTNSTGDTTWTMTYGGTGDDAAYSGNQTADGGYIMAGYTYSFGSSEANGAIYVVKTDANGNSSCNQSNTTTVVGALAFQTGSMPAVISSGGTGKATATTVSSDAVDSTLCLYTGILEAMAANAFSLYPNPAHTELKIENGQLKIESVEIYNMLGEEVYGRQSSIFNLPYSMDVSTLNKGLYFVRVTASTGVWTGKFIKE